MALTSARYYRCGNHGLHFETCQAGRGPTPENPPTFTRKKVQLSATLRAGKHETNDKNSIVAKTHLLTGAGEAIPIHCYTCPPQQNIVDCTLKL
jgi:hypothetical protein